MNEDDANSPEDADALRIPGDTDEERLAEAMRILDEAPPELVQQIMRERGSIGIALDALQQLAMSNDPQVRAEARQVIRKDGLELLLIHEIDPDMPE